MKKHLFSVIAVVLGMAGLMSCQQSGTSGASGTTGATGTTGSVNTTPRRNSTKTQGSASEMPSPIPSGSTAPGPGR